MGKNEMIELVVAQGRFTREQLAGASLATIAGLRVTNRRMSPLHPKRRILLAMRQEWRCHWCCQMCREDQGWMHTATLEHVVPRANGGPNEPWNLVMACHRCNGLRDRTPWEDFVIRARTLPADQRRLAEAKLPQRRFRKKRTSVPPVERWMFNLATWARLIPA